MKRSELLDKLEDYFSESLYDSGIGKSNWTLAEEVLDIVEKVGMLPPVPAGEEEQWEQFFYQGDMYLDWDDE